LLNEGCYEDEETITKAEKAGGEIKHDKTFIA
jgi:hypothetical protein